MSLLTRLSLRGAPPAGEIHCSVWTDADGTVDVEQAVSMELIYPRWRGDAEQKGRTVLASETPHFFRFRSVAGNLNESLARLLPLGLL